MVRNVLNWIGSFFSNLIGTVLEFLGDLFGFLFQKLFDLLKQLFKPILILIEIIFYFLYKIGLIVVSIVRSFFEIAMVFVSLIKGIFATLAGLTWTPTAPNHGTWSSMIGNVASGLQYFQLDKLAYVFLFLVWIGTAFAAIKILSSMRGGN